MISFEVSFSFCVEGLAPEDIFLEELLVAFSDVVIKTSASSSLTSSKVSLPFCFRVLVPADRFLAELLVDLADVIV